MISFKRSTFLATEFRETKTNVIPEHSTHLLKRGTKTFTSLTSRSRPNMIEERSSRFELNGTLSEIVYNILQTRNTTKYNLPKDVVCFVSNCSY